MAILNVTEYSRLALDADGKAAEFGREPALAAQNKTFTDASVQTNALQTDTHLIRVVVDTDAYIAIGLNPTAAPGTTMLFADKPEYFGVPSVPIDGAGFKVAAISV